MVLHSCEVFRCFILVRVIGCRGLCSSAAYEILSRNDELCERMSEGIVEPAGEQPAKAKT